jgi:hypothetical protein
MELQIDESSSLGCTRGLWRLAELSLSTTALTLGSSLSSPMSSIKTEYTNVCVHAHMQALVDGPSTGVARQAINFRNLSLTDFKVKIGHSAASSSVKKVRRHGIRD